jgi:acyl-CoA thioester hydrolase
MRWGDMDAVGHLNNTYYFRYLEQIRLNWLEAMGHSINPQAGARCWPALPAPSASN